MPFYYSSDEVAKCRQKEVVGNAVLSTFLPYDNFPFVILARNQISLSPQLHSFDEQLTLIITKFRHRSLFVDPQSFSRSIGDRELYFKSNPMKMDLSVIQTPTALEERICAGYLQT